MIELITLATAITLGAIALLTRPLFRPDAVAATAPREELAGLRDRLLAQLHELEVQRNDQSMDAAVGQTEQARLEFELAQVLKRLDAAGTGVADTTTAGRKRWPVTILLGLLVPLLAGGVYVLQNRDTLQQVSGDISPGGGQEQIPPQVMEMVAKLEKRLESQPNDAKGWAQLGRSYSVLNRPEEARAAFAKAYALAPEDVEVLAGYAWLLYSENPQRPTSGAVALYRKLQKLQPKNQDAMWVLGLAAFHEGSYRQAVASWEKLYATLQPETPAAKGVASALAEARNRLQGPPKQPNASR